MSCLAFRATGSEIADGETRPLKLIFAREYKARRALSIGKFYFD
jgi:hypothetical protein